MPAQRARLAVLTLFIAGGVVAFFVWQRAAGGGDAPGVRAAVTAPAAARGRVLDRSGRPLAENRGGVRRYPQGELGAHLVRAIDAQDGALDVAAEHDVVLTIDLDLQKKVERAVRQHDTAAVAVVEVNTGRILALLSKPSFDPGVYGPGREAELRQLERDPRRPLVDRTIAQASPPASTFKVITAIAGLETGAASTDEEMTCTGKRVVGKRVIRDMGIHGTIDFVEALQHSCNIYFWTVGERVGVDRLSAVARRLGYGATTGIGLDGEAAGQLPHAALYGKSTDDEVMRLNAAIGSGDVRATVIQVAMAYAALANGGKLYAPQLVRRVQTASGKVIEEREPVLRHNIGVSPATLAVIHRGLFDVVNERGGTAFTSRRGAVKMAGKTGTTKRYHDDPNAWFASWAPVTRPRIVVVVLLEHGGVGGLVAAPVGRRITDAYFSD